MGRFYGIKILSGSITIDDVPKLWRKAAESWLTDDVSEKEEPHETIKQRYHPRFLQRHRHYQSARAPV